MEIREASLKESLELSRFKRDIWLETYENIYSYDKLYRYNIDENEKKFEDIILDENQNIYVFYHGEVVGYLIFGPGKYEDYKDFKLCINALYIKKTYQGKGLGRKSFNLVKNYCEANKISKFYNCCNYYNKNAKAFYSKMGGRIARTVVDVSREKSQYYFEYYL